jgi:DNA invertase Pin-like site-specific DNA recombinase
MTVHGYCRSSQPPKALRTNPDRAGVALLGVESQRAAILERFPDAVIYCDVGRSGRTGRRPALRQMLDALEPGDVVAVARLDRLARDTRLAMALELQIETTCGCRLLSLAGEGTSLDGPPDPVAVFQRRIAAAAAELQAHQASAATAAAFAVRRKQGLSTNGHAPFGFAVGEGGRIVPHAAEQLVVDEVHRFTRGRLDEVSGAELADRLNACGYLNRDGRPWSRVTAKRLATRLAKRHREKEATT